MRQCGDCGGDLNPHHSPWKRLCDNCVIKHRRISEKKWLSNNLKKKEGWVRDWILRNPDRHRTAQRIRDRRFKQSNPDRYLRLATLSVSKRYYRKLDNWIEDVDREILFRRDNGKCHICLIPVDPNNWHMDHIIPISKNGEHSYANTAVSHPSCNMSKSNKLLDNHI